MILPNFSLGPPPDLSDPRRLQWDALLWKYLRSLNTVIANIPPQVVLFESSDGSDDSGGGPGPTGPQGATGATGSTGATGPTGPAVFFIGEDGEEGPIGPPGQSNASGYALAFAAAHG